jgi:plasmid stabilization system protein ParE
VYRIEVTDEANEALGAALDRYLAIDIELAYEFVAAYEEKLDFISDNPYMYAINYSEVRTRKISKFPYSIHYIVEEGRKLAVVIDVFHHAMKPSKRKSGK